MVMTIIITRARNHHRAAVWQTLDGGDQSDHTILSISWEQAEEGGGWQLGIIGHHKNLGSDRSF